MKYKSGERSQASLRTKHMGSLPWRLTLKGAQALEAVGLVEADGRLVVRDHVQVRGAALLGVDRVQGPVDGWKSEVST